MIQSHLKRLCMYISHLAVLEVLNLILVHRVSGSIWLSAVTLNILRLSVRTALSSQVISFPSSKPGGSRPQALL